LQTLLTGRRDSARVDRIDAEQRGVRVGRIVGVGSSTTPMTYVSPKTGRQFVVVSVGGAARSPKTGDYVMAFALPERE
jgi:glucose dehydrogenase